MVAIDALKDRRPLTGKKYGDIKQNAIPPANPRLRWLSGAFLAMVKTSAAEENIR